MPSPTTGPSARSSITPAAAREPPGGERGREERADRRRGPRPMCDERRPSHASCQPGTSTSLACLEPVRRVEPAATRRHVTDASSSTASRVMRNAPVTLARVAAATPHRQDRRAAERKRGVRGLGGSEPAVPEGRAGADDARADRAHDGVEALRRRTTASAEATPTACDVAVDSTRPTAIVVSTRPARCNARTASDSETGNAPPASWTYATRTPSPDARADRRDLAVERAADDGHPGQRRPASSRPPRACARVLARACTEASSRARPASACRSEAARQVRVAGRRSRPIRAPSSRACTLTSTSSPSATGPVSRGYATHEHAVDLDSRRDRRPARRSR